MSKGFLSSRKFYLKSFSYLAGALGFEPRMQVPKTRALPLGYAPILISYNTKKRIYIVFATLHQQFLYFLLNFFLTSSHNFLDLKYATIAEPDPVILTKLLFEDFSRKFLIFFNLGNLDREIASRESVSYTHLTLPTMLPV